MKFSGVSDFGRRISSAHSQPFIVNRTKPLISYIFAGKNKVAVLIFSSYIESSVSREKKLHNLKVGCRIGVKTVHISAAFPAFKAFSGDFVFHFFRNKVG